MNYPMLLKSSITDTTSTRDTGFEIKEKISMRSLASHKIEGAFKIEDKVATAVCAPFIPLLRIGHYTALFRSAALSETKIKL